jgi:putative cell wall-binding protein
MSRFGALVVAAAVIASTVAIGSAPNAAHASPPTPPTLADTAPLTVTKNEPLAGVVSDSQSGNLYVWQSEIATFAIVNSLTDAVTASFRPQFTTTEMDGYAVNPATGIVYLVGVNELTSPAGYEAALESFNGSTGAYLGSVPLGSGNVLFDLPIVQPLSVDSATNTIFVNIGTSIVEVDGSSNSIVQTISLGFEAVTSVVDDATGVLFVAGANGTITNDEPGPSVTSFDISSGAELTKVNVPGAADSLAIDSTTDTIFDGGSGSIAVIDGATDKVTATISNVGWTFVVDPVTDTLFTRLQSGGIAEIDASTEQPIATIPTSSEWDPLAVNTTTGNVFGLSNANPGAVDVLSSPISISSGPPAEALQTGVPFSFTVAAQATTAITYKVTSGALPSGLALDAATGAVSGTPTVPGAYTYTISAIDAVGAAATASYTQRVSLKFFVSRIAGADRFDTSVALSQAAFPNGAPVVFVADGLEFPDALSAGPAAAAMGGPVLLTAPTSLPPETAAEITRLNPSRIVVVGGPAVVSDAVMNQLSSIATTDRWAGPDRYQTSALIDKNAFGNSQNEAFLATGENYPDALAAGSVAAAFGIPILLVPGSDSTLDSQTRNALNSLGTTTVYIAGGTGAVSSGIESALDDTMSEVDRFAGADRYSTAEALNESAWDTGDSNTGEPASQTVYLATGANFPDALSTGPLAGGVDDAPLYLVPASCIPKQVMADIVGLGAWQVEIVGGASVVSESVADLTTC